MTHALTPRERARQAARVVVGAGRSGGVADEHALLKLLGGEAQLLEAEIG
jgi:hypothetical protein